MGILLPRIQFLEGYIPPVPSSPTLVAYSESPQDTLYSSGNAITCAASFTWATGDVVVVAAGTEDGVPTLTLDNETNLTFTPVSAAVGQGGATCWARMWYAVATGAGSGAISGVAGAGFGGHAGNISAWHWTDSGGIGNTVAASSDNTAPSTPTQTMTASANSAVVTAWYDYAASTNDAVAETNTGTVTARLNNQFVSRYTQWAGDWIGVSAGSANWGTTDGAGLILSFAGTVEVLGP